jgi:hypothetical protein
MDCIKSGTSEQPQSHSNSWLPHGRTSASGCTCRPLWRGCDRQRRLILGLAIYVGRMPLPTKRNILGLALCFSSRTKKVVGSFTKTVVQCFETHTTSTAMFLPRRTCPHICNTLLLHWENACIHYYLFNINYVNSSVISLPLPTSPHHCRSETPYPSSHSPAARSSNPASPP